MLVANNSFDLWQRDTFFSAAEEVQRSADIMESAYRTWEREKREKRLKPMYIDELCRELQTALGTAKWQLEEFGKAVAQSYRIRVDATTMTRHKQFVDTIENQISRVETSLNHSFNEQGKNPLRWVDLDEEESDDLAAFLSGSKQCIRETNVDNNRCARTEQINTSKASFHVKTSDLFEKREKIECEVDGTSGSRTTWSSSNIGEWKIVIDPEEDQNNNLVSNIEVTPKDKGTKHGFWRPTRRDKFEPRGDLSRYSRFRGIGWFNQILRRGGGCQRQLQAPIPLKLSSMKFKLILMLTLFLVVPFLIYSA